MEGSRGGAEGLSEIGLETTPFYRFLQVGATRPTKGKQRLRSPGGSSLEQHVAKTSDRAGKPARLGADRPVLAGKSDGGSAQLYLALASSPPGDSV